jgi:tRNA pseudouridine13 synthase
MNWSTGDLPGIGGSYKLCPEDFFVEELPLYPCSGQGEHLYLKIEKRGLSTPEMLRQVAASLNLPAREIGYAGLKDAQAITRQWISVPANCEQRLARLNQLQCQVLATNRHDNKLRLGHLAGNRFRLLVRKPDPQAKQKADLILQRFERQGVPNRFGEQRYGLLGNSHLLGHLLLTENYTEFCQKFIGDPQRIENSKWQLAAQLFREGNLSSAARQLPAKMSNEKNLIEMIAKGRAPKAAVMAQPKPMLRLYLSALQSWLFDQLLQQRQPDLGYLQSGDLAIKHINGACFLVNDPENEQPRADHFEISPTAPLFGSKIKLAEQGPGDNERALLKQFGLRPENWKISGGLTMTGERRALRVPISAIATTEIGSDLQVEFCLPRGSYATCVLNELIKKTPAEIPPLPAAESN